jgi:hypothetical protein
MKTSQLVFQFYIINPADSCTNYFYTCCRGGKKSADAAGHENIFHANKSRFRLLGPRELPPQTTTSSVSNRSAFVRFHSIPLHDFNYFVNKICTLREMRKFLGKLYPLIVYVYVTNSLKFNSSL